MLAKPGSSRTAGSKAYSSNRRKQQEDPTDQLRKISKAAPNKKCADCGSKLPQCINISVGSFICMACAGVHREINLKVKSLGHSTFTDEEVEMMRQTDNDKVNALWLARYNVQTDRIKPPQGNGDQNHLRTWIHRKYQDKQWYGGSGGGPPPSQQQQRPQQGRSGRGGGPPPRRGNQATAPQPTMVQIPPAQPPAPATEVDLFASFDAPAPAQSAPAPTPAPKADDDWAAFGGSSDNTKNNAFGGDPFATTTAQQSNAAGQLQHNNGFANFESPPQQQLQHQPDPFALQQPPQQTMQQQQPPPQQQGFANFQAFPAQQQPQQQQVQQQHVPVRHQNSNTGFDGDPFAAQQTPAQKQPAATQQMMTAPAVQQQLQQQPNQQQGFANFQGMASQQAPQQMQPMQAQQGFANFEGTMQSQQTQSFAPQQQQQQQQMQQHMQLQPPQQIPPPSQNQAFGNFSTTNSNESSDPFANMPLQANAAQPIQTQGIAPTVEEPQQQQAMQQEEQQLHQQPSAPATDSSVMSAGVKQDDPMDAFAHLSVGGETDKATGNANAVTAPMSAPVVSQGPKYEAKDYVRYKTNGDRMKAQILKVHLDDELHPFYTIVLPNGREKQTDDAHLEPLDPLFEKIESKLVAMSSADLKQVETFLSTMVPIPVASSPAPAPAAAAVPVQGPVSAPVSVSVPVATQKDPVPLSVAPPSPSGSHISQLTQPTAAAAQTQMPNLSATNSSGAPVQQYQQQGALFLNAVNNGISMGMMNGGASNMKHSTIPSPHPMENGPVPANMSGHMPAPPMTSTMSIPSPPGKSPAGQSLAAAVNMSQTSGQIGPPQLAGQPQQHLQPPAQQMQQNPQMSMQGQMGGAPMGMNQMMPQQQMQMQHQQSMPQMMPGQQQQQPMMPGQQQQQLPPQQMMMQQGPMGGQGGAPQQVMMPPQQQMTNQQPQGQMGQFQQHNQSGLANQPQGNPFDMY